MPSTEHRPRAPKDDHIGQAFSLFAPALAVDEPSTLVDVRVGVAVDCCFELWEEWGVNGGRMRRLPSMGEVLWVCSWLRRSRRTERERTLRRLALWRARWEGGPGRHGAKFQEEPRESDEFMGGTFSAAGIRWP